MPGACLRPPAPRTSSTCSSRSALALAAALAARRRPVQISRSRSSVYRRPTARRGGGMIGCAVLHSSGSHHMLCLLLSVLFIPSSRPPLLLPLLLLLPLAPALPLSLPASSGPGPVNPTPRPATLPHYLLSLSSHCHLLGRLFYVLFSAFPFLRCGSFSPVVFQH
jgi:hypothetical protein